MSQLMLADRLGSLKLPVANVERRMEDGVCRGMLVTFENGMTFSVQWHSGSYSNVGRGYWEPGDEPEFECAAWYPEAFDTPGRFGPQRKWFKLDPNHYDDIYAYQTIPQVLAFARVCADHVVVEVLPAK